METSELKCAGCGAVGWVLMRDGLLRAVCETLESRCPSLDLLSGK